MSSLLKKIIFSLLTISLIALLSESVLRLSGFKPKVNPFIAFAGNPERSLAEKGENYSGRKEATYLVDSVTFWKFKPSGKINPDPDQKIWKSYNSYWINSRGFRGDEFSAAKPSDTVRIIALGDSITFGLLVAENKTYYKQLEKKLNKIAGFPKVEVISAGIPGYTSYQGKQLLKTELLGYSPDIVIIYFGGNNEFARGYYTDRDYAKYIQDSVVQKWFRKSLTLSLLRSAVEKIKTPTITPPANPTQDKLRVPLSDFADDLQEIARLVIETGAAPILVVPPHSRKNLEMQPVADQYSLVVRLLADIIPTADADREFKKQDADKLFAEDYFHPNETGHQLITETAYPLVVNEIRKKLVEQVDPNP